MSKNKVWNRGKHNGRGLPPKKETSPAASDVTSNQPEGPSSTGISLPPRINTVQRMNRDNWVGRVTPPRKRD
ncbi:hypothetical protein [Cohnella luojiensis]|uniref:Uncharacterized protein n=1 Tax=Cohnella luojiensis TaxID=652876 RepID=A0A4Y8LXW7_9BACL|nr:hypothetical protein [Cohnella luojiensis]TFE25966.1 hypothetical protein E2980_12435 [Cohnella luojiensis]